SITVARLAVGIAHRLVGLDIGHGDRPLRDDPDARDPAERLATTHGLRHAAAAAHRRTVALLGAVVGRLGPAAANRRALGLSGMAAQRPRPHEEVLCRRRERPLSRSTTSSPRRHRPSAQPTALGIEPCSTARANCAWSRSFWSAYSVANATNACSTLALVPR